MGCWTGGRWTDGLLDWWTGLVDQWTGGLMDPHFVPARLMAPEGPADNITKYNSYYTYNTACDTTDDEHRIVSYYTNN